MKVNFHSQLAESLGRQNEILILIGENAPTPFVLRKITELIEYQLPTSICSILLLNECGDALFNGVSPHLPEEYIAAMNGIKIGANAGSCGTAAYLKKTIIVTNIEIDPLWENYRTLALAHGLMACWSMPIITPSGHVIGTIAIYFKTSRTPTNEEMKLLEVCCYMAGIAIEFRENKRKLIQLKHYHPVTTLPNHGQFIRKFERHSALNPSKKATVMMINLNRFRMINTARDVETGNHILKETARRLATCLTKNDLLFHYHSDQFIIFSRDGSLERCKSLANRIISTFKEPFKWKNQYSTMTASIGISQYPNDSKRVADLIKYSELAANNAKIQGDNTYRFFNENDKNKLFNQVEMESELRRSLEFKDFELHYQPYIHMTNKKIIGYEALIRWNHPTLGLVSPAEFIPLAEKTNLIIPIGEWVLKTACIQHQKWQREFLVNRSVSVNLSPKQFEDPNLVDKIALILEQTGMDGRYLTLEITETTIIKNFKLAAKKLAQLMELGIQIAIDDFGMDHSSLNYLKELPINKIKIDRSFVRDVLTNEKGKEILRTIVDLGHRLHFDVLAEGVEVQEQFELLDSYGCDECQGFLISKPLNVVDCERFLSQLD